MNTAYPTHASLAANRRSTCTASLPTVSTAPPSAPQVALPEGSAKDDPEGHPLQNVKAQGLCWSWRNWLEDQLGLAEKSVEEFWAVLQSLGPGLREGDELVDAGGGAVAQAALDLGSR